MASLLFVVLFGSLAVLVFLLSSVVLWARQPALAVDELRRYWWLLLLPGWCMLSTFWSDAPDQSLRLGLQLAITFGVAITLGARLAPRRLVLTALAAVTLAAIASLLFGRVRGDGAGWLGIFGSKNSFAFSMSLLTLLAAAVVLGPEGSRRTRLLAIPLLLLGGALMALGQSAGALVSTGLALVAGLMLLTLRGASPALRVVVLTLLALGAVAAGLVAWEMRDVLSSAFLSATGKDVTLTGRTELWVEAFRAIAERPLLGHGFLAFWLPGNPVAEAMWDLFGIESKSGFHFHNTWISNAVEIGLIGVALQLALFVATLVLVLRWALERPTAASLFFSMFMLRQSVMSMVEVVVYHNFSLDTILVVAGLVMGLRVARAARRAAAPLPPRSDAPARAGRGAA
jgi:exopolysaccharide production protein ExoQ